MQPAQLRRGNKFQRIVQEDYEKSGAISESHISFEKYAETKKKRGRIDIFVDDVGDSIAIFEIKATNWDRIKPKNIRRNIYKHQKRLFDYVYKYYFVDERYATYGLIYPAPPKKAGLRELIEETSETKYMVPVYWYTELNEAFDPSILD